MHAFLGAVFFPWVNRDEMNMDKMLSPYLQFPGRSPPAPLPLNIEACSDLFSYFMFPAMCVGKEQHCESPCLPATRGNTKQERAKTGELISSIYWWQPQSVLFLNEPERKCLVPFEMSWGLYFLSSTAPAREGQRCPIGFVWYVPGLCGCWGYPRASQMAWGSYN